MNAELLDELDTLQAKATPGEWFARDMEVYSEVGGTSTVAIEVGSADAALIVAAVNALPQLTAALRAVLAACEEMEDDRSVGIEGDYTDAAFRIRDAITATLGGAA